MTADHDGHRTGDISLHVNDRDGAISIFIMGVALMLLLLVVIAVIQAI